MATTGSPSRARAAAKRRQVLARGGQVELVGDDEGDLVEQRRVMCLELLADDLVVALGIGRREVDDVGQDSRVRATWRRKASPSPAPLLAPSIRPGMSATVTRRSSAAIDHGQIEHAQIGLEGRERICRDRGRGVRKRRRGGSTCRRWADRPDRHRRSGAARAGAAAPSPGSPCCEWVGARLVEVAKWTLPRPPRPPRATITCCSRETRSASRSPVSRSRTTVPGGTPR